MPSNTTSKDAPAPSRKGQQSPSKPLFRDFAAI